MTLGDCQLNPTERQFNMESRLRSRFPKPMTQEITDAAVLDGLINLDCTDTLLDLLNFFLSLLLIVFLAPENCYPHLRHDRLVPGLNFNSSSFSLEFRSDLLARNLLSDFFFRFRARLGSDMSKISEGLVRAIPKTRI